MKYITVMSKSYVPVSKIPDSRFIYTPD